MKGIAIALIGFLTIKIGFSQNRYNQFTQPDRLVTVQVVPTLIDYDGLKFGFGIGANISQVLSVNYFHLRDYNDRDIYYDNRYSGLYINLVIPIFKKIEIGPSVRFATMNTVWQRTSWTGELRLKFSRSFKAGLEKSLIGSHPSFAAKLIFNLY